MRSWGRWHVTTGTIRTTWVEPNIPAIRRTDFGRTPDVSAQYPQACVDATGRVVNVWR